jgi:hypothetical protein
MSRDKRLLFIELAIANFWITQVAARLQGISFGKLFKLARLNTRAGLLSRA